MSDWGKSRFLQPWVLTLLLAAGSPMVCHAAEDLTGLVDPTAPLHMSAPASGDAAPAAGGSLLSPGVSYQLNSVLIRSNDRLAVVNDQRVRVGDTVGTARVAAINNDGVILEINGETRSLALFGAPVKTLVPTGQTQ